MARPVELPKSSKFILLAAICIIVAALYFAQEVLIPLALAVLVSFLLTPVVRQLERWRLGRVGAVCVVTLVSLGAIVGLGYVVTGQVLNLAGNLDQYTDNIVEKLRKLTPGKGGVLDDVSTTVENVQRKLDEPAPTTQTTQPSDVIAEELATRTDTPRTKSQDDLTTPAPVPAPTTKPLSPAARALAEAFTSIGGPWTTENPFPTAVVQPRPSPMQQLGAYAGVILGPVGTAGLVVVFVIFMLLQREDLRDRIIRLVGGGQLNITTQALDDAATRISRYLLAQAIVNGTYGLAVTLGLWIIGRLFGEGDQGFPNFVLWGVLCAILRFIPYIGPWIAAAFPIALAFATFHGFGAFGATLGMFVFIELLSNNLMEPWLYGSSTGMSTVAILASAVFWTWLWGPVGLLLATPLTVILVVIGKYVPRLQFLDILLGDEPVLEPPARVYQRLLALDQEEAADVAREAMEASSLESVFDDVLIPALAMAEQDRHRGKLDVERADFIRQSMRELVDELADDFQRSATERADHDVATTLKEAAAETVAAAKTLATKVTQLATGENGNGHPAVAVPTRGVIPKHCTVNVVCLPAHDDADEIVGLMLQHLLQQQGYCVYTASVTKLAGEMMDSVEQHEADAVVVSAIPPGAVSYSRYLCKRLHARFADLNMVVGLWSMKGDLNKARERVTCDGSVRLVTTLHDAMEQVAQLVQPAIIRQGPAPDPAAGDATAPAGTRS